MPAYRRHLPQLAERVFLTDGGLETTLIYLEDFELPDFAAERRQRHAEFASGSGEAACLDGGDQESHGFESIHGPILSLFESACLTQAAFSHPGLALSCGA